MTRHPLMRYATAYRQPVCGLYFFSFDYYYNTVILCLLSISIP